jgi:hypothetical protein
VGGRVQDRLNPRQNTPHPRPAASCLRTRVIRRSSGATRVARAAAANPGLRQIGCSRGPRDSASSFPTQSSTHETNSTGEDGRLAGRTKQHRQLAGPRRCSWARYSAEPQRGRRPRGTRRRGRG